MGDFPDWSHPHPLSEKTPGVYSCELALHPGVYRYKIRVAGRMWMRDPRARLLDRGEVFENCLAIVGGSTPPLVFAPDRQHVAVFEDGRAVFHVEVADASVEPGHVWIQPDPREPRRRILAPLQAEAARGDWRLLRAEAHLPREKGRRRPVFGFDFGPASPPFALPEPRGPLGRPPGWVAGAVFYSILLDRWERGSGSPAASHLRSRRAPSTAHTFYGGDLDGVRESLPYLQDLGVTALVLSPVHPSPTPHRQGATDLLAVDPALGGEAALGRLVTDAHARSMRVVVEFEATHLHAEHAAFQHVLSRQKRSRLASWFQVHAFPVVPGDPATYACVPGHPELPRLRLDEGPAREHVLQAAEALVAQGVDGLRLTSMDEAPEDLWAELRARVRRKNPELLLLGALGCDSPARFAEERGVDLATDAPHRKAMLAFFARGEIDADAFWERLAFDRFRAGPFDEPFHLCALDDHDTARFRSQAVLHDRLRLALCYLLLRPDPVALTYGTELGMAGSDPGLVLNDPWPERQPMPPLDGPPGPTHSLLRALTRLRREYPATALRLVSTTGRLLVLDRVGPRGTLRAYLNAGSEGRAVDEPGAELVLSVNDNSAGTCPILPGCTGRLFLLDGSKQL